MDERSDMRRMWRLEWLGCLADFADRNLQQRMWLDPEQRNPHWSYVEFMCCYFDDVLHGDTYDWALAEGLVTAEEVQIVGRLHRLLTCHDTPDNFDHARILADPSWHAIVAEADKARQSLLVCLKVLEERNALLGRRPIG